jgi:hypothetical protein
MAQSDGWISIDQLQWHRTKRVDGLSYHLTINRTSGQQLPFCCYATLAGGSSTRRRYLGPASTLAAAKIKCERLEQSSRDAAQDETLVAEKKPTKTTTKTRVQSLRRR